MTRVLFCSSEVHPFSKTGGLADLAAALPAALAEQGHDVRIVTPGYRQTLQHCGENVRNVATIELPMVDEPVNLLEARLPGAKVPVYIVDAKHAFDREGDLYLGPNGQDWPDNHLRFTLFSRAIVEIAMNRVDLDWQPEVAHCNDWQTGLVPALLSQEKVSQEQGRPRSVFTINNLAYQGLFSYEQFSELELPESLWSFDAMEFNGYFSMIKGGLVYADWLVAVSPSYADEIKSSEYGWGLDGLLRHRADRLVGIVNGIDEQGWDPSRDRAIHTQYDKDTIELKTRNKRVLQMRLGFSEQPSAMLVANIGRLAYQKGTALIVAALPRLMEDTDVQFVMLGTGDPGLERQLRDLVRRWPQRMAFSTRFSESVAHQIEAAADIFAMPSLYEPCGLNQMYSMRYGTIPVVRRTGGLKDTVSCLGEADAGAEPATGFCFDEASPDALLGSLRRAISTRRESPDLWRAMMTAGMGSDFSWGRSAEAYVALYNQA